MIELSKGLEKSLENRKIRDIIEIYVRKLYNRQNIYEYFNIDKSQHEKYFDIVFPNSRIIEFLKKEELELNYKKITEKLVDKTSSLEYRLNESKIISDYITNIISKKKDNSEYSNISNILLQMSLSKYISIIKLTEGIKINNKTIVEPFSIFPILRSIYETYSVFNNIFIKSENYHQIEYKYNLFKLSSLNYRQKFPASQKESKDKKDKELLEIDNIKTIVKNNSLFKQRNIKVKERDIFDKKSSDVDNSGIKINYSQMVDNSGINNSKLFEEKYNYLSMLSHPSYIGCLQFGETFSNNVENEYINTILLISNALMSGFINDYKKYHIISDKNIYEVSDNLKLFYNL